MSVFGLKSVLFTVLFLPFLWMVNRAMSGLLIDPVEEITHWSGEWALRFLLLTLAVTPVSRLTGYSLIKYRRMIGLFSFFYACLHMGIWLIDREFSLHLMIDDVIERTYITLGFLAFLAMLVLALTSNRMMMRRLAKNWQKLHRLIYLIAILAVIHFYWQAKSAADAEPLIYGLLTLVLLAYRFKIRRS